MSTKDNGGPAFPQHAFAPTGGGGGYWTNVGGMTLRDWFAGQALAGILSGGFAETVPHDDVGGGSDAAHYAYQYADAMLAKRAKQ